jgi:hypothetical protein
MVIHVTWLLGTASRALLLGAATIHDDIGNITFSNARRATSSACPACALTALTGAELAAGTSLRWSFRVLATVRHDLTLFRTVSSRPSSTVVSPYQLFHARHRALR